MKNLFAAILIPLLMACTSLEQPVAQISLVEDQDFSSQYLAAQELQALLNQESVGSRQLKSGQTVMLTERFFSARGLHCRYLNGVQNKRNQLYCLSQKGYWYLIPPIFSQFEVSAQ